MWMVLVLLWAIPYPTIGQVSHWSAMKISGDLSWDDRPELPNRYRSLSLDIEQFSAQLATAPLESDETQSPLQISLPMPDGENQHFLIQASPIMEPGLAAKFPQIRTYAGRGVEDPTATLRITDTPHGIGCMILSAEGAVLVEPATRRQAQPYLSYRTSDLPEDVQHEGICGTVADAIPASAQRSVPQAIGQELLTYRIAVTASSTYTQWAGGTVADAISEITSVISQVNMAMERDLSIRLILVANNDQLVILPGQTDPFNTDPDFAVTNLQTNHNFITSAIGSAAFDIGHVFIRIGSQSGTYVAGIASVNSVCSNNAKGRGASTSPNPGGFGFVSTVTHEIGHQYSARHSFNSVLNGCNGNRTGSHAYEPGSGSTIMAYASCDTDNLPFGRQFYFHTDAQESIINFTRNFGGSGCTVSLPLNNQAPTVDASNPVSYIPISTPFELTGMGADSDGDSLTYCWEQFDLGPAGTVNSPVGNAPIFRSFPPVPTPHRTFPSLSDLLTNSQTRGELLPTYDRDLTFRLTVRDQNGGVATDEIAFEVTENAGPFEVLYPSDPNIVVTAGYPMQIQWDVAFTDLSPINCSRVDIYLSTDEGLTFPYLLLDSVPNTGSASFILPDIETEFARIKIKAANNVFFDLSNQNFSIELPLVAGFDIYPERDTIVVCGTDNFSIPIYSVSLLQFSEEFGMTLPNLPADVIGTLSTDSLAPGDTAFLQLAVTDTLVPGIYPFALLAFAPSGPADGISFYLEVVDAAFPSPATALSPSSQLGIDPSPVLTWASVPEASSYRLELASNPGFGSSTIVAISGLTDTTYSLGTSLAENTPYYWRVQGENPCGNGAFSETLGFQTGECAYTLSADVPLEIPEFGALNIVSSTVSIPLTGTISSIKVVDLAGSHQAIDNLEATLTSPAGTTVTLFSGICGDANVDFNLNFSDDGEENIPCAPTIGGLFRPVGSLSDFVGQNAFGTWTLTVTDTEDFDGGQVNSWGLEMCQEGGIGPVLVKNLPLNTSQWFQDTIPTSLLQAVYPGNTADELVFTVVSLPEHGGLLLNGSNLVMGDNFSQEDIDQSKLAYLNNGNAAETDSFRFDIVNALGNWVGVYTYQINIAKGATSIDDPLHGIRLSAFPNPAHDRVHIDIEGEVQGDVRLKLLNLQGQAVWIGEGQMQGNSWHKELDVSSFSSGLYLVQLSTLKGVVTTKLFID